MIIKENTKEKIHTPREIFKIMHSILMAESENEQDEEHFWTVGLDNNNVVKYIDLVSLGTVNATVVHPREVFRMGIQRAITAIVLCHNHPSGNLRPSAEDLRITGKMKNAGDILDIKVLDHLIISEQNFYSFAEEKNIIS